MNLAYIKVKEVINTIENKFNLKVSLKQITSLEWETWFENTHSVSVESIQRKITKDTYGEKNDVIKNLEEENLISEQYEDAKNIENDLLSDFDDSLEEESNELADDENDEALIKLAQARIGEDSEIENDILFGEELTSSRDPVISELHPF